MESVSINDIIVKDLADRVAREVAENAGLRAQLAFLGQEYGKAQERIAELEASGDVDDAASGD